MITEKHHYDFLSAPEKPIHHRFGISESNPAQHGSHVIQPIYQTTHDLYIALPIYHFR